MAEYNSRRLSEIKNEFERGVFFVLYNSPKQRYSRLVAMVILKWINNDNWAVEWESELKNGIWYTQQIWHEFVIHN